MRLYCTLSDPTSETPTLYADERSTSVTPGVSRILSWMIIYLGPVLPLASSGTYAQTSEPLPVARVFEQPCSERGLPSFPVTRVGCGLLPHSFHPYPCGRFRFCG